jgi:type IV pilus assembly protein PilP
MKASILIGCALVIGALGCETPVAEAPPSNAPPAAAPKGSVSAAAPGSQAPEWTEADFTESDGSRDPFHPFREVVKPTAETKVAPQYNVVLDRFGVDELKLVAIVRGGDGMRAMFVDPLGKGWIVTRGMHLGRGDVVKVGTGVTSYPLHWKVDRIKPAEVVLVREDPLHPEVQPSYREIPLHIEGEKS